LPLSCSRQGEVVSDASAEFSSARETSSGASASPAAHAPSIRFVSLEQLEAELSRARARGLLLNFWAIWCAPCVAELPGIVDTAHAYADRGGSVILVSYDMMIPGAKRDDVQAQMAAFVAKKKIDVPVLIYEGSDYEAINARFELPGEVPVTLAIDRNGKIVDRQEAQSDKKRFAQMMERALAP
jgi:thiol-disulfide isomerase/thioredoxin